MYPGQRPLQPKFRSVSRSYFESVCGKSAKPSADGAGEGGSGGRIRYINSDEITESIYKEAEGEIREKSAGKFFEGWVGALKGIEEECVSNDGSPSQIFDFWYVLSSPPPLFAGCYTCVVLTCVYGMRFLVA